MTPVFVVVFLKHEMSLLLCISTRHVANKANRGNLGEASGRGSKGRPPQPWRRCSTDGTEAEGDRHVRNCQRPPCGGIISWKTQPQVTVERTICEVRGVERQPAAQVLVNPPAGLEEVFALQTEGKRWDFQRGKYSPCSRTCAARAPYRPRQEPQEHVRPPPHYF